MKRKSDDFLENKENEEKDDGTAAAGTQASGQTGSDKESLGKEPIGKLLFRLAVPTVAAQLINMLYNIVDRIYIGHIPEIGATALTGVGVCMPLIMIVSAFAALVGYGGAPRASIFMGKQDKESAEKTLGNCFVVQIIISVILTAVLLIWNRDLLMAFGASSNTIGYAVDYMNIYALGTIFVEVTLGMNAFITAQGFAKTGMLSVLIGAVANIILDPVFIFGLNMDVRGAALATIISQALSCIWVVWFLCGKKTFLKIRKKNFGLVPKIILPCLALGTSTFIMQASLCYSVILWLFVMLFPGGFAALFTTDAELMEYTKTALRIYMAVMFLFGIQVACQMTFNALGKAVESIVVAVMRKFVLLLPLIYIMPQILQSRQTTAVYMAEPIADTVAVTFTAVLFAVQFRKVLASMKKKEEYKTAE